MIKSGEAFQVWAAYAQVCRSPLKMFQRWHQSLNLHGCTSVTLPHSAFDVMFMGFRGPIADQMQENRALNGGFTGGAY